MKIYIHSFNIEFLFNLKKSLFKMLDNTKIFTEVYTNESMYHVDDNNIYLLETIDGEIKIYEKYFGDFKLITDSSYYNKKIVTSLHGNQHVSKKIEKNIYKLNPKSKLKFVIEMTENLEKQYEPNDVYFEYDEQIDIKDIFVKREIIEFLSVLN
jgi:hypothetical protein